ncbi:MAG: hypothetical protein ABW215_05980 [Kibdelosporangium sp.]
MTGHPSSGWRDAGPRQEELARLRTFCVLNAVLFLVVAAAVAVLRLLVGEPFEPAFLAQELLCSAALVVLAATLLWVRGAIGRGPAVRAGGTARAISLVIALVCLAGGAIVVLTADGSTFPTVAVTAVVIVCAFYSYAGMSKLRATK